MKFAFLWLLAAALAVVIAVAIAITRRREAPVWCPLCDGGDPESDCECPNGCGMPTCGRYR